MDKFLVEDFDLIDYQASDDEEIFEEEEGIQSKSAHMDTGGSAEDSDSGSDKELNESLDKINRIASNKAERVKSIFTDSSKKFSSSSYANMKREFYPMQVMGGTTNNSRKSNSNYQPEPSLFFYSNSQADFIIEQRQKKQAASSSSDVISTARGGKVIRRSSTPIIAVYRHLNML